MKLLRGCVSNDFKDRKFPGRFGRGQEVADDPAPVEEREDQTPDVDLTDSKIWTKGGAAGRLKKKGMTLNEIDNMKGMTGDEQVRYMNQVFNFYAMEDNQTSTAAGNEGK